VKSGSGKLKVEGEEVFAKPTRDCRVIPHVKALFSLSVFALSLGSVSAAAIPQQQPPLPAKHPIRIPVRSADPWFIKFALEGQKLVSPELSTLFFLMGAPQGTGSAVNTLFDGGKLLVNPTDNSLWWYPD